jgi:RNA polymerase sigma-70 factor, ECF subfamily
MEPPKDRPTGWEHGMMTDADLVRRTLAGHTDGYAELVRRWAGRVTALCHARVRRADVAEDMAQETLLRGFRSLHTLHDADKFGSWLCGIASRACLDWLKARERSQVAFSVLGPERQPDQFLAGPADDATARVDREDEAARLMEEVEALSEEHREVILLYYYNDITYRELAQMLGVSAATVNARLTQARAILRERLSLCRR